MGPPDWEPSSLCYTNLAYLSDRLSARVRDKTADPIASTKDGLLRPDVRHLPDFHFVCNLLPVHKQPRLTYWASTNRIEK